MTKDDALKLALRLCEEALPKFNWGASFLDANAITLLNTVPFAIKEALEQPEPCKYGQEPKSCTSNPMDCQCAIDAVLAQDEQEPVAKYIGECHEGSLIQLYEEVQKGTDFYTAPSKREWVGLTDAEAMQICVDCGCMSEDWLTLLDAIEAKLKEKNT